MKLIMLATATIMSLSIAKAADNYSDDLKYIELRDSMRYAFNDADSVRFFPALYRLEEYLLGKGDMHAYYTQRCNEIVFLMNQQHIYEAYMLAYKLSSELRKKGLDKEMYMAYNMLGHINRYCGNKATAKENFKHVLELMEKYGYWESMPPIYMNIVNVELDDDPEEATKLLDKAKEIAEKYTPDRVFDIETRKTLSYYNRGDIPQFLKRYEDYKKGIKEGMSTVHGRNMEIYYLAATGKTDEAVKLAKEELGDEKYETIAVIYENAKRWEEACQALHKQNAIEDSITNVVLINSMHGIREQLSLFEAQQQEARTRTIGFSIGMVLLVLLAAALTYIVNSRRRHLKQLQIAYDHALESDRMKTAFIQNVSHEIRTPLNIITGFAQVISNREYDITEEDRNRMLSDISHNTNEITNFVNELLELSESESQSHYSKTDDVDIAALCHSVIAESESENPAQLQLLVESTLPDGFTLKSNAAAIHKILTRLMSNALKFTEQGSVTIKLGIQNEALRIEIEDTGIGILPEHQEKIFERFYKVDTFKQGIGLGLTVARRTAVLLDGTLTLDSSYTTGARFVLTLPTK